MTKTFTAQGRAISTGNYFIIILSALLIVLFSILGWKAGLRLSELLFVISALRAYVVYRRYLSKVQFDDDFIYLFKPGKSEYVSKLSLNSFLYKRKSGLISLMKTKGSDEYFLRERNWDKELLGMILSNGQNVNGKGEETSVQDKASTTSDVLSFIQNLFS